MDSLHCAYTDQGVANMTEVTDWISAGAAVVAAIAAVAAFGFSVYASGSAKASANAAKEANRIQLHTYRKELYLAFRDLYSRVYIEGDHLKDEVVFPFNEQSLTSYLYVNDELAKKIEDFYTRSRTLAANVSERDLAKGTINDLIRLGAPEEDRAEPIEMYKMMAESVRDLHKVLADLGRPIRDELKELSRIEHD